MDDNEFQIDDNIPGGPGTPLNTGPSVDDLVREKIGSEGIDPTIKELVGRRNPVDGAKSSLIRASLNDPDEMARYVKLSQKTGLDPEFLFTDGDVRAEAQHKERLGAIDFDSIKGDTPVTAAFLSDPVNASIAYDDVKNMSALEYAYSAIDKTMKFGRSTLAGMVYGTSADFYGDIAAGFGMVQKNVSQPLINIIRNRGLALDQGGNIPYIDLAAMGEQYWLDQANRARATVPHVAGTTGKEGMVERAAMSGGESLGQFLGTLAVPSPNKTKTVTNLMALLTGGRSYTEARNEGLNQNTAAYLAANQAVAEKVTEMIPVKYLFSDGVFKSNLMKAFFNFQIREGATEQVATLWQDFNDWAIKNPDKTVKEFMAERPGAAVSTAIATTLAGMGQVAVVKGISSAIDHSRTKDTEAFFDALSKGLNESKLHKRIPEKTKEFIKGLTESGGVKNVYIDASQFSSYFQSKEIAPETAATELLGPDGAKQLAEALVSGGDIVIPLEDYATKVVTSEHHQGLSEDLRLHQGDASVREAKLQLANLSDDERKLKSMLSSASKLVEEDNSVKAIYDSIHSQAVSVGVPPSQADTWATLEAARYRTRAIRLGVDPQSLWEDEGGLQIARSGIPTQMEGVTTLNQSDPNFALRSFMEKITKPTDEMKNDVKLNKFYNTLKSDIAAGVEETKRLVSEAAAEGVYAWDVGTIVSSPKTGRVYKITARNWAKPNRRQAERGEVGRPMYNYESIDGSEKGQFIAEIAHDTLKSTDTLFQGPTSPFSNSAIKGLMYHGTRDIIEKFDINHPNRKDTGWLGDGAYFTNSPVMASIYAEQKRGPVGPNVVPVYLNITNPYMATRAEKLALKGKSKEEITAWTNDLKDKGYDGVMLEWSDGTNEVVAFDPATQVQSAITGQFMQGERDGGRPTYEELSADSKGNAGAWGEAVSRVADDGRKRNGVLQAFYHAGSQGQVIRTDKNGVDVRHPSSALGGWLTESVGYATKFGEPHPYYIALQNPYVIPVEDIPSFDTAGHAIKFRDKLIEKGHDGIILDGKNVGAADQAVIFHPDSAVPKHIYDKVSKTELYQKERGMVQFGNKFRMITLLEDADLSTFIHELGHTWLEEMRADSAREGAPQQIKDDWSTLQSWLGIADGEAIPVDAHEKFARGTEAYFMEGAAPSPALRKIFNKVKHWMKSIYKTVSGLNVRLNDDVRAVFDRLIAIDEEIDRARALNGFVQMFSTPEQAGMTEAEFKAYSEATTDARRYAEEKLTERVSREMKIEETNKWRDALKARTAELNEEVKGMPVYQAIWYLSKGTLIDGTTTEAKLKLSKDGIIDVVGQEVLSSLSPGKLKTSSWVYSAKGGVHPDTIARMFGFRTGKALIDAIMGAQPMNDFISEQAQQRVKDELGDPMSPDQLAEKANEEVYTNKQEDLLATELRILRRKMNEVNDINRTIDADERARRRKAKSAMAAPVPFNVLREVASSHVSEMKVKDINPSSFLFAEIRNSKKAQDAAASGEFDKAAEFKQQQILNYFMYESALSAKKETDKIINKARGFNNKSTRKRIGKAGQEWLEQIDSIMDRYSLYPMGRTEKARGLVDWAKSVEQSTGEVIAISPDVIDESKRTNVRELTVNELRSLNDTLTSIEHVAKKINSVIKNGKEYETEKAVEDLVNAAHNIPSNPMPNLDKDLTTAASIGKMIAGAWNSSLRPEKIFERLDGGKSGIWHDLFWNPAVDARNYSDDLRRMVMVPVVEAESALTPEQKSAMNDSITIESIGGRVISRRHMIGIALNTGNKSNLEKLKRGGMYFGEDHVTLDDFQLAEILDNMGKHEWDLVQSLWGAVDLLYPHLNDLNIRAVGIPLERVEASPVDTKYGNYAGGYWPAVADPRHNRAGEKQEESTASILSMFAPSYPKAATAHSFREERTGAVYPLQFDWERVLSNHINRAITDVAYHEWIKQSRRLLENGAVKKSIQNTLGDEIYRSLEEWLVHQTIPIHGGYSANQPVDTLSNTLLSNTVVAALGFKAATAIGNMVVAPVQASHQVKTKYLLSGFRRFMANPYKATMAVHEMSGEMRHRFDHYEQSFNMVLSTLEGKSTIRAMIARQAMMIHLYMDKFTSTSIWMGKYEQGIDEGLDPEQALRLADKTIRTTQTAGAPNDLSSFERDPRYKIFKMFIGPMIIMQNEMRGSVAGKGAKALISPEVWSTMFATWIIPSVLFELFAGRGPGDDEEWWQWALRKILLYPAQTIPFVRDAANAAEEAITGEAKAVRSNPITDTVITMVRAFDKALSEDAEFDDMYKAAARSAGVLLGLPTSQVLVSMDFLVNIDEVEGFEDLKYLIYKREE